MQCLNRGVVNRWGVRLIFDNYYFVLFLKNFLLLKNIQYFYFHFIDLYFLRGV